MEKKKSYTGRILLDILLFCIVLVVFVCAAAESVMRIRLKFVCTEKVTGVVEDISTGFVKTVDLTERRFLDEGENKTAMRIAIDPASGFGRECIYANPRSGETVGTEITVFYSPEDSFDHYIRSWFDLYKTTGLVTVGSLAAAVLLIVRLKKLRRLNALAAEENVPRHLYYDTQWGRFLFDYTGDVGYECEMEWPMNQRGEKTLLAYFDTDALPELTREDFAGMTATLPAGEQVPVRH